MSNYSIVTNFLAKDSLITGNPAKAVKGADLTTEYTAVQSAVNTKIDGAVVFFPDGSAVQPSVGFTNNAGTGVFNAAGVLGFATNALSRVTISVNGNIVSTAPASGIAMQINGVAGTHSTQIADASATLRNAGFLEVPQNQQNGTYTTVLADSGKQIYNASGGTQTHTIASNASVPYPIGTVLTFIAGGGGSITTIAIASDTLIFAGVGSTGSRTLGSLGVATAIKFAATSWMISGPGLT